MNRKKALFTLSAGAALVMTLAACGGSSSSDSSSSDASAPAAASSAAGSSEAAVPSGDPVVLGTSLPLTGPLGIFGPPIQAGYEQAVAAINAAGGIDVGGEKRPLSLVVLDNKSDPTVVTSTAKSLKT